jgi:AcrR family transcriptional regulator
MAASEPAASEPAASEPAEPEPPAAQRKAQLPAGLDLLWGRRGPGKRGPRPGLSADAIVDAAMRLADAEGLEGVSMARVAAELGFTTMSLYRYVTGKEELLQLMWNGSARDAEDLVLGGDGWRARLRGWAIVQREALDRHPWLTQMPMAAPPVAPNSLIFVERGLETMDGTPLADADKLRFIGLISSYTLSEARMANDALRAAREEAAAAGDAAEPTPPWTFDAKAWTAAAGRRRSARSSCSGSTAFSTASRRTWTGPGRRASAAGVSVRSATRVPTATSVEAGRTRHHGDICPFCGLRAITRAAGLARPGGALRRAPRGRSG